MRVLIAEDEVIPRLALEHALVEWGYEVVATADGASASRVLMEAAPPSIAILDWIMPGMDGIEVCSRVRQRETAAPTYLILLTARNRKEDIVAGLEAGADDYLTKPFDPRELQARVRVGRRMVELQRKLADRVAEVASALAQVKELRGLLPVCAWCRKVRDDANYWQEMETYISRHSHAQFSHGICPPCLARIKAEELESVR
jgi:phosphoserine phosphatase RsbU/P